MRKRFLATLLCLCMVLTLLPVMSIPALAAPEDYSLSFRQEGGIWNLYKGYTTTVYDNQPSSWSVSGNTLTLTDFEFETITSTAFSVSGDANITLVGDNVLNSVCSDLTATYGLFANGNITINGNGSLTATGGISNGYSSAGIMLQNGVLTIDGNADVTAIGNPANSMSRGVASVNGTFLINGGSLTASGVYRAFEMDYTVPNEYKYWTGTTTAGQDSGKLIGDGSTTEIDYTHKYAKIEYALPSSEKDITAFSITGQSGSTTISSNTVAVTMPYGTDVTALTPTITVSPGASVTPLSGAAQDFTSSVTYTVTAADASAETYTVTVAVAPATAPGIPQSFTATPGNGQVALSWTAPASNGGSTITKYEVSSDNGGTWTDVSTSTAHTFTGLTNGTAYTFKVRAVNAIGDGAVATATATPTSGGSTGGSPGGTTTNSVSPATAAFDKTTGAANNKDIVVTLTVGSGSLSAIKNGSATLVEGTDYTKSGNTYTIKAAYLATLPTGTATLTFDMSSGADPTIKITVIESEKADADGWVNPFIDVNADHWFYEDVKYVHQNGLFAGTSATTFSPNMPMTRGMVVTVLGRLAGIDVSDYSGDSFDDVDTAQYYAPYVKWAAEMGIVSGVGNNNYAPNADISRQDLAVILYNYAKVMGITLPETATAMVFNDGDSISGYAKEAVEAMQKAGIISGKPGGIFDPKGNATRAEVAAMLHRFCEAVK